MRIKVDVKLYKLDTGHNDQFGKESLTNGLTSHGGGCMSEYSFIETSQPKLLTRLKTIRKDASESGMCVKVTFTNLEKSFINNNFF